MQTTEQMLASKPKSQNVRNDGFAACVDACAQCEVVCVACADACLGEQELDMLRRCIRLNLDCADLCGTTARMLARASEPEGDVPRTMLTACILICAECARECEEHEMEHCKVCARVCRSCEERCRKSLDALPRAA